MSLFNTRLGRGLPRSPRCCRLVEVTNKRCAQRGSGGAPRRGGGTLRLDITSACLRTVPTAPAGSAALCKCAAYVDSMLGHARRLRWPKSFLTT